MFAMIVPTLTVSLAVTGRYYIEQDLDEQKKDTP